MQRVRARVAVVPAGEGLGHLPGAVAVEDRAGHADEVRPGARVGEVRGEGRVALLDPDGVQQLLADGSEGEHLDPVDQLRRVAEEGRVVDLHAPEHAHDLVALERLGVDVARAGDLPVALGGADLRGEHQAPQVADARVLGGEAPEGHRVPGVDRLRGRLLVARVPEEEQAAGPGVSRVPVHVSLARVVGVAVGRIGDVTHEVQHRVPELLGPRRVGLGERGRRIDVVAVVEVVVVVVALPERRPGVLDRVRDEDAAPGAVVGEGLAVGPREPGLELALEARAQLQRDLVLAQLVRDQGETTELRQLLAAEVRIRGEHGRVDVLEERRADRGLVGRVDRTRCVPTDRGQGLRQDPCVADHPHGRTLEGRPGEVDGGHLAEDVPMVGERHHQQGAVPEGAPLEAQRPGVLGDGAAHASPHGDPAGTRIEDLGTRGRYQRHADPAGQGLAGAEHAARLDGELEARRAVDGPGLAVVQLDRVLGPAGGRARASALPREGQDRVHRGEQGRRLLVQPRHVGHPAHQGRAQPNAAGPAPLDRDGERIVLDHLALRELLRRAQAQVVEVRLHDERLLHVEPGAADGEALRLHLHRVGHREQGPVARAQDRVLPPAVGGQRRGGIGPEAAGRGEVVDLVPGGLGRGERRPSEDRERRVRAALGLEPLLQRGGRGGEEGEGEESRSGTHGWMIGHEPVRVHRDPLGSRA